LPVALSLVSVSGALGLLLIASSVTDIAVYAINVVTMFGLGLGIDYGLLITSRFREERAAGREVDAAIERAVATAGMTVAFSGVTVAVALCGLTVFESPGLRSLAIGGIGVTIVSVGAALTLLPALLALVGARIRPARSRAVTDTGAFARLAAAVQRFAIPVVGLVAVALAVGALPFLHASFENPDARSLPRSSPSRQFEEIMRTRFGVANDDPVLIVADAANDSPSITAYAETLRARSGVERVEVSPAAPGAAVSVIEVFVEGPAQGEDAQHLVNELRDAVAPFPMLVAGGAAEVVDTLQVIRGRLPLALGIMASATLVLLFLMTGSVVVAIKAITMNVLSLGATFGVLVWGFQDGHLGGLLGFDAVGALDATMPLVIFIFAFGLSMDYEVFLLSRIKEEYDRTGDNRASVALGLERTGRIVSAAAALLAVTFIAFGTAEVSFIKAFGLGLALAVLMDATVIRGLLVPAFMRLAGDANWWAPAPLRRLHERFGLGEAPGGPGVAPAEPVEAAT
jgi:RND superfamily putative drug exporter